MDAHINLTGMAVVGLAALLCGMLMARLKQPALVGYIVAGVLLGPSAFGVVEDREQIGGLAELGVLLLLFLIGTELSVRVFMVTWKMALSVVALQIAGSLAPFSSVRSFWGSRRRSRSCWGSSSRCPAPPSPSRCWRKRASFAPARARSPSPS